MCLAYCSDQKHMAEVPLSRSDKNTFLHKTKKLKTDPRPCPRWVIPGLLTLYPSSGRLVLLSEIHVLSISH